MNKTAIRMMAVTIIMLALALMPMAGLAQNGAVGTAAPEFSLDAQGGGSHSLSQYHGRVVVLFIIGYG
jgi:hypothetical protein